MYKNHIVPKVSSATLFSLFSPRKAVCDLLVECDSKEGNPYVVERKWWRAH